MFSISTAAAAMILKILLSADTYCYFDCGALVRFLLRALVYYYRRLSAVIDFVHYYYIIFSNSLYRPYIYVILRASSAARRKYYHTTTIYLPDGYLLLCIVYDAQMTRAVCFGETADSVIFFELFSRMSAKTFNIVMSHLS
jgi:hypothetical protein